MSVVQMARLEALVLDRHAPRALAELAGLGQAEFFPPQVLPGWASTRLSVPEGAALLPRISSLAKRAAEVGTALSLAPCRDGEVVLLTDEVALSECEGCIAAAAEALAAVDKRIAEADARSANLKSVRAQLQAMAGVTVDVASLRALSFLEIVHVRVPVENTPRLGKSLADRPVLLLPLGVDGDRSVLLLAYPRSLAAAVDTTLTTLLAERATIPEGIAGAPSEALRQVEDELFALDIQRRRLLLEREEIGLAHRHRLPALWAQLKATRLVADLQRLAGASGRARVLAAWIPATAQEQARSALARATGGAAIVRIEPLRTGEGAPAHSAPAHAPAESAAGELAPCAADGGAPTEAPAVAAPPVPTKLKNHPWLAPFESLVSMYGRPSYGEIDPTPVIALSFITMFGVMFGDLGQGALLFLTGWLLRWRAPKLKEASLILRLCAASSMVFGCLYGDLFGWHFMHPLWLKPMEDTMHFLKVTAIFGVFFMTIGLAINIANTIRNREWGDLLFGKNGLAGIWFYWGTLVALVVLGVTITWWIVLLLWVVPCVLMFFREPLSHMLARRKRLIEGGLGEFLVGAFFELFETVIGYLSNTISFVRLAAFALNHAGLFTVVFLLAKMVDAGAADTWVDGAILVVGNIFIIGLEGLVVTIQALRLEYYEFFSKFFRGTGVPFRPARLWEEGREG